MESLSSLIDEITKGIREANAYHLDPSDPSWWPELYIPKVVVAGDEVTGKSSLIRRLTGIEDYLSPADSSERDLLGKLSGCVQVYVSLRTNGTTEGSWSIVNNRNGDSEFTSSTFGQVIAELSRVRGRVLVLEDKRLVYTVRSSINLDIIEMSRVADEGYNVSEREILKLVANNGRNAYFVCVSMLLQPVRESRIWNLIKATNGQVRGGNVSI